MTESNIDPAIRNYGMLDLLEDELEKVKRKIPQTFDSIAEFLAISRPIVELTLMNCGDWTDQIQSAGPGKPCISHASLMLIHLLSKMRKVSYRQIEREVNAHPMWLKALHLKKAPSHSTLSIFRTQKGPQFFNAFFDNVTQLLHRFHLITAKEVIVDSAPILASMNFARANATPKINLDHVRQFFTTVDVIPAVQALHISRKRKYTPESIIRFFMFEKLGKFLSTSQALQFLRDTPEVAEVLGFEKGKIPVQATFTYFLKTYGPVSHVLEPMVDNVTDFFDMCGDTPEDTDIDFFFWSF